MRERRHARPRQIESGAWAARSLVFSATDQETFERLIQCRMEFAFVTGPTGPEKPARLYACLNYINSRSREIITVEEPIEYQMTGINQVRLIRKSGMTFSGGLALDSRQAPNVIK